MPAGRTKVKIGGTDLTTLVADLKSGPQETRERAAKHIAALTAAAASNDGTEDGAVSGATRALKAGSVAPLVALVASGTDGAQGHAASALANICASGHSLEVASAGAVAHLVTVLRQSSQQAAAAACAALSQLAEQPTHRASILKAGALAPLVRQLRMGLTEAKVSACLTLASLCAANTEVQGAVLAAGAVPVLIGMLHSGKAQMAASCALARLCGSRETQDAIAEAGGIPLLLSLLNGVNVQAQVHAAAAVAALARDNPETQLSIFKAGGIGPLLALLPTRSTQAQANGACALARLARYNRDNQEAIARQGGIQPLLNLLAPQLEGDVQAMASMALAEVCRGAAESQSTVSEYGGISSLVVLLKVADRNAAASSSGSSSSSSSSSSAGGSSSSDGEDGASGEDEVERGSSESVKSEAAGALWVLAEDRANRVSIASAGALPPLVQLLASGGSRAQLHAGNALASVAYENTENQAQLSSLLVHLLGTGSPEAKVKAASLLWRLVRENPSSHHNIAASGTASDLIALLKAGSDEAQAYALWSLSLSVNASNQDVVLEEGGEVSLVNMLQSRDSTFRTQAAAALARLAANNSSAQSAISNCGGIAPLIQIVDPSSSESMASRVSSAAALAELTHIPASRDAIIEARGIPPLVALLTIDGEGEDTGERHAAAALAHIAAGNSGTSASIAEAGAISPLVKLLTGGQGEVAQQEAAGALYSLADDAANRIAITDAGGIGPLVLLLGSSNTRAREHAEGALVRLSIENANRELIIKKLVSMLYDKGSGGEEQAAAALANLASDSADNRNSIVEAGGIEPLLALLELSASPRAKENAISAISQLAHNAKIQEAIAKAGGVPLLANALASTSSNGKEMVGANTLYSLSAFAINQLARGNRANQLALADAGSIPPLVAMLGSPSSEMQANAAGALSGLSHENPENQAAVARTGAIAPLCSLVREGAANVKEQSAAALWSLSSDNAPNKATVAKLGGIEPLVGLLVSGSTDASLEFSVGALGSLAARHADNCETIAKMLVARLSSRMAMTGAGSVSSTLGGDASPARAVLEPRSAARTTFCEVLTKRPWADAACACAGSRAALDFALLQRLPAKSAGNC